MRQLLRRLYSIWCLVCFVGIFLILYPFFWLSHQWQAYTWAGYLNRLWAWSFLRLSGLPYHIHWHFRPSKDGVYIMCSNHNSYLDIVMMGLIAPPRHVFVGKASLTKPPLFGSMFARLHIPVRRESKIDAYKSLLRMKEAVANKRSVIIFPEGGIREHQLQRLAPFKEGAFRLAIVCKLPIVPVVFPYNWRVLPDDKRFLPRWHRLEAVVLPPIDTRAYSEAQIDELKRETYERIFATLHQYYPNIQHAYLSTASKKTSPKPSS